MPEIKNAKIVGTFLGVKGDAPTATIMLQFERIRQIYGGFDFRVANQGMEFIYGVLQVAGKDRWEDLMGAAIRVDCDPERIYRIGHITEDVWFEMKGEGE